MSSLTVYLTAVTSNCIVGSEKKEEGHMSKGMAMLKSLGWSEGEPMSWVNLFTDLHGYMSVILRFNSIVELVKLGHSV